MANWSGLVLTRKGELLHAKVEINLCKLHLTKIKLGSGVLEDGQQLETLADLIRPRQTVDIGTVTDNKDGTVTVAGIITNAELETGYTVTEMGLFAADPDEGEILYVVTRDAHPDYLPAKGGATIVAQEFNLNIGITNATNVTATIHMGSLATIEHIQKIIKMLQVHNVAPNAHEKRFKEVMAALGGYLPLVGGVMNGAIIVGNCPGMKKATDREETYVYGGTTNKDGAAFGLRGVNCTEYGEEWYYAIRWADGRAEIHGHAIQKANNLGITLNYPIPLVSGITGEATVVAKAGSAFTGLVSFTFGTAAEGYFTVRYHDYSVPNEPISICFTVRGYWK